MKIQFATVKAAVACATLVCALAGASPGFALEADEGVRLGANTRFQPGILISGAYQSNVYRTESDLEGDVTLRLEPHLRLVHRSANANLDLWGEYHFKKYMGAYDRADGDDVGHKDLDVFLNYLVGVDLVTRPDSPFSFMTGDKLSRISREFDNSDLISVGYSRMDNLTNQAHIGVEGRPGRSLRIQGLFHFDLGRYTGARAHIGPDTDRRVYGQAFDLYGSLVVGWKFFPRTQLMLKADWGHILWDPRFSDPDGAASGGTSAEVAGIDQNDSDHWRVWLGVQGKFSRKISLQALIGYGNAYFPDSAAGREGNLRGVNGLLGKAQLHWKPIPTQRITIGFVRDYRYIYFADYYVSNSPYVRYHGQIAGFLLPRFEFAYLLRDIHSEHYTSTTASGVRTDHEIRINAGVDFQIADFFSVGPKFRLWSIVASNEPSDATFMDIEAGINIELGF